jgi:hypothetical protein
MKVKITVVLFGIVLFLFSSCTSKTAGDRKDDSSRMTDSSIMNHPDTLDNGLDTSVIDTTDTAH